MILSAGTLDSPKLLMLSGIGDAKHLQALGISVVVDLPGVGQNLQDHVVVSVAYQAIQDLYPAITSNAIKAGAFLQTEGNSEAVPDLQFGCGPISWPLPGKDCGIAGCGCLHHANDRHGKHERTHYHDRRKSSGFN